MGKSPKQSITKRVWFWPVVGLFIVGAIIGSFGSNEKDEDENTSTPPAITQTDPDAVPDELSEDNEKIESGTYTLPCGMKIQFFDSVRNDVTGNWRRSATSDSFVPSDYALEYYNEMFSSDDEIHSIWNATLKTTTSISVSGNLLFVDTYEYVEGEEHDAKIMFTGTKLDSRIVDKESGEPLKSDDEPKTEEALESDTISDPEPNVEPEPEIKPGQQTSQTKPTTELEPEEELETQKPAVNQNANGKERRSNWASEAYLGSSESDKYHDYECRAAKKILPENEVWFSSVEDASAQGYEPCGICYR